MFLQWFIHQNLIARYINSPRVKRVITIIAAATANVTSVAIADATGVITVTMTAAAGSTSITLTPTLSTGNPVTWVCAGTPAKYVPANCRS